MVASRFVLAAGLGLAMACGSTPVSPSKIDPVLSSRTETAGIVFRFTPGDAVDADWQQRFHDHISAEFGINLPTKLTVNKYRDRLQLREVTGRDTNGFAEPAVYAVHTIFPHDGHEAIHVYSALVGRPSDFFNEGLAVALDSDPAGAVLAPRWNGTHVYEHTQLLIRTNRRRPLATILTTDDFRNASEWVAYGEAGSFVLFLIEQHGLGPMLTFVGRGSRDDASARIETNFRAIWGMTLAQAETNWLEHVRTWVPRE